MANTIRIKRRAAGVGAGAPSGLANAELAYNEGDNILYYGFGTGGAGGTATQVIPIAGSGAYLNKNNNLSDLNNTQTSRNNLAGGTVTSGLFMRGNGTNVLMGSIIASDIPTLNQNTTGNAGTVTNGVYTSRTITPGSGLAGSAALDLSADRTFNIGQGDGITVSADSIAVDSTVVRTTGTQSITGSKTFGDGLTVGNNVGNFLAGTSGVRFTHPQINFQIDAGNLNPGFDGDALRLDIDSVNGYGYITTLKTSAPVSSDIILRLPSNSGALARLEDITTTNITGTLAVNKGGTGATTLTSNNILVGNGTSAISAPYSVETTLTGGASAIPRADAVKTYVDNLLGANDAMVFKGTIGTGGTVTSLPTTHSAGWAYRVITAATFAGKVCEIGDLLIAIIDRSGSSNSNDDWTVVQTNLDGAVVGPASSTTNALAVFNGTTGKLIQNSSFVPTTVGGNLINLANPSAITFPKINADNTVSTESAATHRTSVGATTVGSNLFTLTNPGAISFLRINADNTITALSDVNFRTAIGAGTSSTVGTVTVISAGSGMNYSPITSAGSVTLGTPSSITLSSTNSVTSTSHTHAFAPGGTTSQYIRGDGVATSGAALTKTDDTNVTLTIGGSPTNALLSATSLTLGWTGNLAVNRGGTGQTSYTNGELLIGNTTSNTLTKATLTQGSNVTITNGNGSITIASTDTNTATAADDILDGSNTGTQITYAPYATNQAASASPRFYNTSDNPSGSGRLNVSAYFYATNLYDNGSRVVTAATICSDAGNCTWDGGSF